MSEQNPEVSITQPYGVTSTEAIDRANRLQSLLAHPGFRDLVKISYDLSHEPNNDLLSFEGWDGLAIAILKARAQTAREQHKMLFERIKRAIMEGVTEAQEMRNTLPEVSARSAIENSDYVRTKVLEKFSDMDNRVAGSF